MANVVFSIILGLLAGCFFGAWVVAAMVAIPYWWQLYTNETLR